MVNSVTNENANPLPRSSKPQQKELRHGTGEQITLMHSATMLFHDTVEKTSSSTAFESLFPRTSPKKTDVKVVLCGCGNAVHVLTSFMGKHLQNHPSKEHEYEYSVNVLSLGHAERLAEDCELSDGYIRCTNDLGNDTYGKANVISGDAADVVPGCNVIIFALPTDRHEMYLTAMKPYIQEGTIIGSMPGEGGFDLCVRNVFGP